MKNILVLIISLIMFKGMTQNKNVDFGIAAVGLVVSDIKESERFYTDLLGMISVGEFELDNVWAQEAGASNGQPFAVKMFKLVDGDFATVLKLAYFDSVEQMSYKSGINSSAGVNYLTFYYSRQGFQQVLERLKADGRERLGWVKRDAYQLVFFKDPDGVFIELIGPPDE